MAAPKVGPIVATFKQADFATYYRIDVTPAPGAPNVRITGLLTPPKDDYRCSRFEKSATKPQEAVWKHGKGDACKHAHDEGPRGHASTVFVSVYEGVFRCTAVYLGTVSGTGDAATCGNALRVGFALENARRRLAEAKSEATRGGAGPYALRLIGEAAEMDSAALALPINSWKDAIKTLRAAIKLKEKAGALLRDRVR